MDKNNQLLPLETEICIVGAGPAGIITSLFLARQGIKSLVLDKSSFPRSKPCADCITGNTIRILKDIAPNAIQQLLREDKLSPMFGINAFSSNNSKIKFDFQPLEPNTDEPSCYTVQRKDFDNLLANEAKNNPFITFIEKFSVSKIDINKNEVTVREKDGRTVKADMLVNASGSNSTINEKLNGSTKKDAHTAVGIRAYFEDVVFTDHNFCELFLSRKLMPGGMYLSPLPNNRANVNLVLRVDKKKKYQLDLKKTFNDFLENNPLLKEKFKNAKPLQKFEGSLLELGTKKRKIYGDRFLMAGDAAALIDILSANGIPQAFMSGKIAAKHIERCHKKGSYSEKTIAPYQKEVRKATKNYLRMGRIASPFMKSEALLNLVDFFLNTFSAKLENSKTLETLVYHKKTKKSWIKPHHYKRLFFGMKN